MRRLILAFLAVTVVKASPGNFACSRRINVGGAVMVSQFQESSAGSITLDSIACNGNLTTGVTYKPMPVGAVAATRYLIDVTTESGEPFPGANFTQGFHVYGGKTMKSSGVVGNVTAWVAYGNATRMNPGTPENCATRTSNHVNGRLVFSTPGLVTVRMAWSNDPVEGVMVTPPCRYTVRAASSTQATTTGTPSTSAASGIRAFSFHLFILACSVIQCLSFALV
jgi:hypothetical protein